MQSWQMDLTIPRIGDAEDQELEVVFRTINVPGKIPGDTRSVGVGWAGDKPTTIIAFVDVNGEELGRVHPNDWTRQGSDEDNWYVTLTS
jgi:hypothetical protein